MSRVMPVGSAFQFGFLPSQHCFLLKYIFQFLLHRGKPTVSLVFPPALDHRLVSAPVNQRVVEAESSGFTPLVSSPQLVRPLRNRVKFIVAHSELAS